MIEGQIVEPNATSISNFQTFYGSVVDDFRAEQKSLRILEIGEGMGNMAYGFVKKYDPELYIAQNPSPLYYPQYEVIWINGDIAIRRGLRHLHCHFDQSPSSIKTFV